MQWCIDYVLLQNIECYATFSSTERGAARDIPKRQTVILQV